MNKKLPKRRGDWHRSQKTDGSGRWKKKRHGARRLGVRLLAPSPSSSQGALLSQYPWEVIIFLVFSLDLGFCQWCFGILVFSAFSAIGLQLGRTWSHLADPGLSFQHWYFIFHWVFGQDKAGSIQALLLQLMQHSTHLPMTTRLRVLRSTDWARRAPAGTRNWKRTVVN